MRPPNAGLLRTRPNRSLLGTKMYETIAGAPDYVANLPYLVCGVILILWLTRGK